MLDILIEVGVEELPISEGERIIDELGDKFKDFFREKELNFKNLIATGTPRRIVLIIEQLEEKQNDKLVKVYGPPKKIFFDNENQITKAGESFLTKNNKKLDEIKFEIKDDKKNVETAVFEQNIIGENSVDLIKFNFEELINSVYIRKRMRWSDKNFTFVRPVRWLLALCNDKLLDLKIGNTCSAGITYGHKILAPEKFEIDSISKYFEVLEKNYVIVDKNLRKKILVSKIRELIDDSCEIIDLDETILDINNFLVEYPTPFKAKFKNEFLNLPEEVLISTMKKHQKYFPVYDSEKKLKNEYIGVSNMTPKYIENIIEGNTKVITARFDDARFYYEEDLNKSFQSLNDNLKSVTYIDGIGSVYNKTERMKNLGIYFCELLKLNAETKNEIITACELSKFDLATGLVYEFPHLQGYMGKHYAEKKGVQKIVSDSISQHYLPVGDLNDLPETIVSKVTALAEKFDTVCSCFLLGLKPTGSSDAYALRRAARGIIAIISSLNTHINIKDVLNKSLEFCNNFLTKKSKKTFKEIFDEINEFFILRIENLYNEKGYDLETIRMSMLTDTGTIDVIEIENKIEALFKMLNNESFLKVKNGFKRVNNILKKNRISGDINKDFFENEFEKSLYEKFLTIKKDSSELIKSDDYEKCISVLSELGTYIDEYFDNVMVMCKDEKVKNNRIIMLNEILEYYKTIYNF
jgi:glycyl-tRNA synthetase beta chain